jgi:hypothetical protein
MMVTVMVAADIHRRVILLCWALFFTYPNQSPESLSDFRKRAPSALVYTEEKPL